MDKVLLNIKEYLLSERFFLDALLSICLYFCFFYYVPYLMKSTFSGEIKTGIGSYRATEKPFNYFFFLFFNVALLLITGFGAFVILRHRYGFF